jgi:hypothetical protein
MKEQAAKPDVAPLVNQLIDKSKAGKLKWQPTANRKAFVVSLGGNISFRISTFEVTRPALGALGTALGGGHLSAEVTKLEMLDENGQPLWDIYSGDLPGRLLTELYDMARWKANNVDERVAVALSALEKL